MKRPTNNFRVLFLYMVLTFFVFLNSSYADPTVSSWRIQSVEPEIIDNVTSYEIECNRVGARNSVLMDMNELELQLVIKHFGVSRPQELVGKVFTTNDPIGWMDELSGRKRAWEERITTFERELRDKYQKAGFSDSAPILDCDFSSALNDGGGMALAARNSVFEKAIWEGDQLEVDVLYNVNCAVTCARGMARINGDRIELTVELQFPSDGSMALCESPFRYTFKIKGLEKKDYQLGFRIGLFTEVVSLKKNSPIIIEPLEITMQKISEERDREITE